MINEREFEPDFNLKEESTEKKENLCNKHPYEMSLEDFKEEYETIMNSVSKKEKRGGLDPEDCSYKPISEEEGELLEKDWKEFSRERGFSEEDIKEYERWLLLSGQTDNLKGAINDPWRRSRDNWSEKLWLLHVEKAMEEDVFLPEEIKKEYDDIRTKSGKKSNNSKPTFVQENNEEENVW